MHLIVTRTFPPEVGGMQNLMYGLAKSLSENVMIKVFADQYPNQDNFDKELSFSIERVSGPKIFKKYRKANLVNTYLENNKKVKAIISDHWKSLENINTELKKITSIFYRILIPRPIAWVSTISKEGIDNLAPFSFYGGVTANPPIVSLGIGKRKGKHKDTAQNLLDTKECVIHLTNVELSEKMVMTSADLPPEEDEFEMAGISLSLIHI